MKDYYKELARKYDMTIEDIKKICDSQFEYTKNVISEGNDETIRLQYLGKFHVTPNRRETLRKRREAAEKGRQAKQEYGGKT